MAAARGEAGRAQEERNCLVVAVLVGDMMGAVEVVVVVAEIVVAAAGVGTADDREEAEGSPRLPGVVVVVVEIGVVGSDRGCSSSAGPAAWERGASRAVPFVEVVVAGGEVRSPAFPPWNNPRPAVVRNGAPCSPPSPLASSVRVLCRSPNP